MGAWIETCTMPALLCQSRVASYMGAWIETKNNIRVERLISVASYMGAWIETESLRFFIDYLNESHPTWVRGLKPCRTLFKIINS